MNITNAIWANQDQIVIIVQPSGAHVGLKTAGDPLSAGSVEMREALKTFLDGGGAIDAFIAPPPPSLDEIYDQTIKVQRVLKAVVLSINDGTLMPDANLSNAELKAIIKANM